MSFRSLVSALCQGLANEAFGYGHAFVCMWHGSLKAPDRTTGNR